MYAKEAKRIAQGRPDMTHMEYVYNKIRTEANKGNYYTEAKGFTEGFCEAAVIDLINKGYRVEIIHRKKDLFPDLPGRRTLKIYWD